MKTVRDIWDEISELGEYADLEGSEVGETWNALISMSRCATYVSDEFHEAIVKEILEQLQYVREHAEIIETEETVTQKYKELEWG